MSLKPIDIKIDSKYAKCIPEMPQKEFEQLKQNIKDKGYRGIAE